MIRMAVVQMNSSDNKQENLHKAKEYIERAAQEGCRLVAFPELFNCMVATGDKRPYAEDMTGETVQSLREMASQYNIYIHGGSMLFAEEQDALPRNLALLYAPDGKIVQEYAKLHLFDVDIPDKVTYRESQHIAPGNGVSVVDTELGKVGTTICYDLRFAELFYQLRERGAEIIFVPAAFTYNTGKCHWKVLLQARAIENQAFVIAPNQCGKLANGIPCYGHSMILDPWGVVLAEAGEQEEMIFASLDFSRLTEVRNEMPMQMHRRRFD